MKCLPIMVLVVVSAPGVAWGQGNGNPALVKRAKTMLGQGPSISPAFSRATNALLRRAATRGPTLYAPVAERGRIMVFDKRTIPGGFASSSVTVRAAKPRAHTWDVQLIREDSSRLSLKDVAMAAKKLPSGITLEVRLTARANGKTSGTYSLLDPNGRVLNRPGDLKALHRQARSGAKQVQTKLGVPASYVKRLLANFTPLSY